MRRRRRWARASTRARPSSFSERVLQPRSHWREADATGCMLGLPVRRTRGMTLAVGADHVIETDERLHVERRRSSDDLAKDDLPRRTPSRASRSGSPSSWPTTPRAGVPARELVDRCRRTLDRRRDDGVDAVRRRAARAGSTASGSAPTSRSRGHDRRSSRRCAGTSSSSRRPAARADGQRHRRQGRDRLGLRAATTSGTPRSTSCRSSPTRRRDVARNLLRFRYRMLPRRPAPRRAS